VPAGFLRWEKAIGARLPMSIALGEKPADMPVQIPVKVRDGDQLEDSPDARPRNSEHAAGPVRPVIE